MRPLFLLSTFLLFSFSVNAQGVELNWANGAPSASGEGHNILADAVGNTYVTGWTLTVGADIDPHPIDSVIVYGSYLAKYDTDGNYIWSVPLGFSSSSMIFLHSGICFDLSGNIIITGNLTGKIDFDPSEDSLIVEHPNGMLFLAKYSTEGSLLWVNTFAASAYFNAGSRGIDIDKNGNIFIGGFISGSDISFDFDPSANEAIINTAPIGITFYMAKYDNNGGFQWVNTIQSTTTSQASNRVTDLAVGSDGSFYITGECNDSRDFDPSEDSLSFNPTQSNIYLAKYDTDGELLWANLLYGSRSFCRAVETDLKGNVFIAGDYKGTVDFDASSDSLKMNTLSQHETFIAKYNTTGDLVWVKTFVTEDDGNQARGMKFDKTGYLYISGYSSATSDFNPSSEEAIINMPSDDTQDNYLAKLDEDGNYIWAIGFGNSRFSFALDVAMDAKANVYTTGVYRNTADFDPSEDIFNLIGTSLNTIFVTKYSPCSFSNSDASICDGDTLFASTLKLNNEGYYPVSYIDINGCDSIVRVHLIINASPNAQLVMNENILSSLETADSYQWIDCDSGLAIENEENQTFTSSVSGNYAVDVTVNNCTSRSDCEQITVLSIPNNGEENIFKVYPNPSSGYFVIESNFSDDVMVYDVFGKNVASFTLNKDNNFSLNMQLSAGIYFIHSTRNKKTLKAVVIE